MLVVFFFGVVLMMMYCQWIGVCKKCVCECECAFLSFFFFAACFFIGGRGGECGCVCVCVRGKQRLRLTHSLTQEDLRRLAHARTLHSHALTSLTLSAWIFFFFFFFFFFFVLLELCRPVQVSLHHYIKPPFYPTHTLQLRLLKRLFNSREVVGALKPWFCSRAAARTMALDTPPCPFQQLL